LYIGGQSILASRLANSATQEAHIGINIVATTTRPKQLRR